MTKTQDAGSVDLTLNRLLYGLVTWLTSCVAFVVLTLIGLHPIVVVPICMGIIVTLAFFESQAAAHDKAATQDGFISYNPDTGLVLACIDVEAHPSPEER